MEKNKKTKLRFFIYLLFIFEILFSGFNVINTCMCGHHMFKVIPIAILAFGSISSFIIVIKRNPEKLESKKEVFKLLIIYFIIFIVGSILCKNDMEKLHKSAIE